MCKVYIRSATHTHVCLHKADDVSSIINDIQYDLLSHGLKEKVTILVVIK